MLRTKEIAFHTLNKNQVQKNTVYLYLDQISKCNIDKKLLVGLYKCTFIWF